MACGYSFFVSFLHLFRKSWCTGFTIYFFEIVRYSICESEQCLMVSQYFLCVYHFRALLHGSILYHKGRWHREKKFECRLGCGESYTTRSYRDSHERRWCVKSTEKEALKQKEIEDGTRARETERCKLLAAKTQDR